MPITPVEQPKRRTVTVTGDINVLAREVIEANQPGQWFKVKSYQNRGTAYSSASRLRLTPHADFPAGRWEILGKENDEGNSSDLFFCWNGPADKVVIENLPRKGTFVSDAQAANPVETQVTDTVPENVEIQDEVEQKDRESAEPEFPQPVDSRDQPWDPAVAVPEPFPELAPADELPGFGRIVEDDQQ